LRLRLRWCRLVLVIKEIVNFLLLFELSLPELIVLTELIPNGKEIFIEGFLIQGLIESAVGALLIILAIDLLIPQVVRQLIQRLVDVLH
jgi:hypothetical protein